MYQHKASENVRNSEQIGRLTNAIIVWRDACAKTDTTIGSVEETRTDGYGLRHTQQLFVAKTASSQRIPFPQ